MKLHHSLRMCIAFLLLAFTFYQCSDPELVSNEAELPPNIQDMCFCNDSTLKDSLCSEIPKKVNIPDSLLNLGYRASFDAEHQPYFDIYSWQAFVALNWPADGSGNPKADGFLTDTASLRVWEYYTDPASVFGNTGTIVASNTERKAIYMSSKFGSRSFDFTESDGNMLVDQNLNYVVFEEKLNPVELGYIDSNGLRTLAGQLAYTEDSTIKLPPGSIELKASWKILTDKDDWSTYYHQPASIYLDSSLTESHQEMVVDEEIGMIGLHIVIKPYNTEPFGEFLIWSTFEHIDNVPKNLQENQVAYDDQKKFSLYTPDCIGCEINAPPEGSLRWAADKPYARNSATHVPGENGSVPRDYGFGTQVTRTYPVYYYTELVNDVWRKKLEGSVWENYTLVGTQWGARQDGSPPFDTITAPQFLANSSMETYEQQGASCIMCHGRFATVHGTNIPTDFSFLFGHATGDGEAIKPEDLPTIQE